MAPIKKGRPREFARADALHKALKVFWAHGYKPTSIAMLCDAMGINPPSLYATFGNKEALFLEAVRDYEIRYWQPPARRFMANPDIYAAVNDYFRDAANILLAPDTPCGCMLVLSAINISPAEREVMEAIRQMRMQNQRMFASKLREAVATAQLPATTDIENVACALNTFLKGLSFCAIDLKDQTQLINVAAMAIHLLPAQKTPTQS